jgi:hypothetical protein
VSSSTAVKIYSHVVILLFFDKCPTLRLIIGLKIFWLHRFTTRTTRRLRVVKLGYFPSRHLLQICFKLLRISSGRMSAGLLYEKQIEIIIRLWLSLAKPVSGSCMASRCFGRHLQSPALAAASVEVIIGDKEMDTGKALVDSPEARSSCQHM